MSAQIERMACSLLEVKLAGSPADMSFTGYGAVFGNIDSYGDVIKKGAFARTIHEAKTTGQWPAMLEQHGGWGMTASDLTPIGVWTDLEEDDVGLKVAGKFAPTPRGQEMHALMKMTPRPAINGLSIGYLPIKWSNRSKPEEPRRTLEEVKLFEISPVTFPANGKARVGSVKKIDELNSLAEVEEYLREVGLSIAEAKGLVARVKRASPREAADDWYAVLETLQQFQLPKGMK
jgi:HK97 family phage prohead protease